MQNIKDYCALRGVKPTFACAASGAGKDIINQLENRGSIPSVEKIQLLARYLGVTTSELLGEENKTPAPVFRDGPDEKQLDLYEKLNNEGQEKLLDYADDLVTSGKYKKSYPTGMGKTELA